MTSGGIGVAFFAPFSSERYFFPWRPIRVSPIAVRSFFSAQGLAILRSELLWVWLPVLMGGLLGARLWSRTTKRR
jgi:inner membrane protein